MPRALTSLVNIMCRLLPSLLADRNLALSLVRWPMDFLECISYTTTPGRRMLDITCAKYCVSRAVTKKAITFVAWGLASKMDSSASMNRCCGAVSPCCGIGWTDDAPEPSATSGDMIFSKLGRSATLVSSASSVGNVALNSIVKRLAGGGRYDRMRIISGRKPMSRRRSASSNTRILAKSGMPRPRPLLASRSCMRPGVPTRRVGS
mmetsp:Transcript_5025/g.16223  ORF Transcript_5025/g.16223 Transcript_5025/m.16223 type:complete len:206 (-) Transcript_5025:707-1324(-)